jgi:hypothetical protein
MACTLPTACVHTSACLPDGLRTRAQRKLTFTFDKLRIRLGPKWLDFPLQAGQLGTTCGPAAGSARLCRTASRMHSASPPCCLLGRAWCLSDEKSRLPACLCVSRAAHRQ